MNSLPNKSSTNGMIKTAMLVATGVTIGVCYYVLNNSSRFWIGSAGSRDPKGYPENMQQWQASGNQQMVGESVNHFTPHMTSKTQPSEQRSPHDKQ